VNKAPSDPHCHHAAAYATIAATLALGAVAVEPERAQDDGVHIWLNPGVAAKLKAMRGLTRASLAHPCPCYSHREARRNGEANLLGLGDLRD
jgi:hypothetical protein